MTAAGETCQVAMDAVMARYGKLNVLINNAGIAPSGSMDMSFELWRKVISINLDGTFLGTKYAISGMKASGEPLDIAYGVLYLASDESKFVLGSELAIDGGLLARD